MMRRHKSDRIIGALTVILLGIGLIVIYAIGPMRANVMNATYGTDYSENYFFLRQLLNVALALTVFIIAYRVPYGWMRKWGKVILIVGLAACGVLMVLGWMGSGMAKCELGACRWIRVGSGVTVQPAEIVKLGLVLWLAGLMATAKREGKMGSLKEFWRPLVVVSALALGLVVVVQKDLGTGVSIMAIITAMLFMSGVPMRYFGVAMGVILLCGVLTIVTSEHRMERLMTFRDAESSDSYHIENAMIAIGTGGWFGVGVGNSVQATGYLPESINDSVFAVMGETFGFIGLVAVVMCFAVLLLRLLKVAGFLHEEEMMLVVVGIFAWAMAHVVVNIASMTGLLPLTGITLPLLSYGGTSMLFMAVALGLALQLSCYTGREPRREDAFSRATSSLKSPARSRRMSNTVPLRASTSPRISSEISASCAYLGGRNERRQQ